MAFVVGSRFDGHSPIRIEVQGDPWFAGWAEPEKLSVRRSSLHCIEISPIKHFELCTAIWIDTAIDHAPPLCRQLYDVPENKAVTAITGLRVLQSEQPKAGDDA